MNNKATIYAFLAVILGYSLMTYIPSTITPSMTSIERSNDTNDSWLSTTPDSDILGSEGKSAAETAETAANYAKAQTESSVQFAFIAFDICLALGVYFLARKRFA